MTRLLQSLFAILFAFEALAYAETSKWDKTISKVTNSVVSIRVNAVRPFDTENSLVTQATGFVVDAKRGIILTNRHVVNPGPITAEAIFSNSEEVTLTPIYRDPVHDFGFFKYDPSALEFIQPQSLKLSDKKANIGDEIKVIGNDSGEHMSILSATLARLDRSAPAYGRGRYNDFNTFYYQSAADTSGGSSGSPVVNIDGEVIALNAGGTNQSASSFFLPLYKVKRALSAIQKRQAITRGSLETTFKYRPYDEVRRLGLTKILESKFRKKSSGDGVLTVQDTLKGGIADGKLRPGDIILHIEADKSEKLNFVTRYEALEIFLDENVEQIVNLTILRQGKVIEHGFKVRDLHSITPDEFIELAGGVFHPLSYQIARQTNLPVKGVYVSSAGYMFANGGIGRGSVIHSINNTETNDLKSFTSAFSELNQNDFFKVKFVNISQPTNTQVANVKFVTNWHLSNHCQRRDNRGLWQCEPLEWKKTLNKPEPTLVNFPDYNNRKVSKIARSLVMVNASLPYHIDGQNYPSYNGTGLVIDAKNGLVAVDRNTVPVKMAQVQITFASAAEVPAEVLFVHPLHSFALLKYDPSLIEGNQVRSAQLESKPLESGDSVWLVGYQTVNRVIHEKLQVSSFDPLVLPPPPIPQYRETNINAVTINNPPMIASGVLMDESGAVRSWWTNFAYGRNGSSTIDRGLPIRHIQTMRDQWLKNGRIDIYSLEVELTPISIANARQFGLTNQWIQQFQNTNSNPQVLKIAKRFAGSDSFQKLKEGDLLLSIDGHTINNFQLLDKYAAKPTVEVSIWRDDQQIDLKFQTKRLSNTDTNEVYLWAGALLQKPHRALSTQHGIENNGVYISWYWYGSPANRHSLVPLNRIIEVEGETVTELQQFIELTEKYKDKKYIRVRLLDLIGRESIITLKQDLHYWPTQKIFWNGERWVNHRVGS